MLVHFLLYYLTEVEGIAWRQEDFDANKIVKFVKGGSFNGYVDIIISGKKRRFTEETGQTFLPILFNAVARKIGETMQGEFAIVPIPGSEADVSNVEEFRTLAHAKTIAAAIGSRSVAVPALRWKQKKLKAHEGGSRDPQIHFSNLVVVEKSARPVVLFDDVMTSGSQMIGSYRCLAKAGMPPVCGFVIGRATKQQKVPAIGWAEEDVPVTATAVNWRF